MSRKLALSGLALALGASLLVAGGCASADRDRDAYAVREIHVSSPPPPPPTREVVVVRTDPPDPQHVWVEGHYVFRDGRYVWVEPSWVRPPESAAVWHPGHYRTDSRGRGVWVPGYWERVR